MTRRFPPRAGGNIPDFNAWDACARTIYKHQATTYIVVNLSEILDRRLGDLAKTSRQWRTSTIIETSVQHLNSKKSVFQESDRHEQSYGFNSNLGLREHFQLYSLGSMHTCGYRNSCLVKWRELTASLFRLSSSRLLRSSLWCCWSAISFLRTSSDATSWSRSLGRKKKIMNYLKNKSNFQIRKVQRNYVHWLSNMYYVIKRKL